MSSKIWFGREVATGLLSLSLLLSGAAGCSDDDDGPGSGGEAGSSSGGSSSGNPPAADAVTEAVLKACPQATTLIETTDWPSCLEGKRLAGEEPFSKDACELRIGEDGAFDYLIDGAVALSIPKRSAWGSASGTYQNADNSGSRFFLASLAPDLDGVEGEPRIDRVTISLFELPGMEDKVEVSYLDEKLARQTYNCTVDVL